MNSVYVSIGELGRIINKCGYEAKPLSYEEWKENLFSSGNEHPLKLLESLFRITKKNEKEEFINRYGKMSPTHFDTTNTDKALEGTGLSCEPMNEALIEKYINLHSIFIFLNNLIKNVNNSNKITIKVNKVKK